jgi:hypothetical protein
MGEVLSICEYRCDLCPAHKENIKSEEDKITVSKGWEKFFKFHVPPEGIGCEGCYKNVDPPDPGCLIRPCAIEKDVENCAYCKEFECESLKSRNENLDQYLKKPGMGISEEEYKKFILPYECKERLRKLFKEISNSLEVVEE